MSSFLVFTVYAPLASWGEIAVGESRGSWDRPSRSAVLGLVAAALGVDRDDQAGHDALDAGYGVAVRLDATGTSMSDYHTAQTVASAAYGHVTPPTRRSLLASGEHQTILSRRGYRQDASATVALWPRTGARWTLEALAEALRTPHFVPYAGRKANPLGLPLDPRVVHAATLAAALEMRPAPPPSLADVLHGLRWVDPHDREVAHDPCDDFPSGLVSRRRLVRRDGSAHRTRWQFANRVVEIGVAPRPGEVIA